MTETLTPDVEAASLVEVGPFEGLELCGVSVYFRKNDESESSSKERDFELKVPYFSISPGEKIGIVGPSGTGKSSLFEILLQQVPFKGEYRLNGRKVPQTATTVLNGLITSVNSHDPFFRLSLQDNLFLGRSIPSAKLTSVLEGTQAQAFTTDLGALVGSSNFHLSTGQMQRLRLARGLINDTEIYLLDEPFSGVDGKTREEIMRYLIKYFENKTLILITHTQAELALVNTIYELIPDPSSDDTKRCTQLVRK